jgi:hypothetical protein
MTQQEIQERNKQIALMLGWDSNESQTEFYPPYQFGGIKDLDDLMFNLDWNWLIEAKRFAERKGFDISIRGHDIMVYRPFRQHYNVRLVEPKLDADVDDSSITEAVFIAVSDFAKLYNEGKL